MSGGINYFTDQMKFKSIEYEDEGPTPLPTMNDVRGGLNKSIEDKTEEESSEDDSISSSSSSYGSEKDSNKSERLKNDKNQI